MKINIDSELNELKLLLQEVPASVMMLFCLATCFMNLLASKEIAFGVDWLALDCGFSLSWLIFLCMDMITKRFRAKAAIELSIIAEAVNLFMCIILFVVSKIPGNWSAYYDYNDGVVNSALNATIGGTWYVVFGSTIAFIVSAIVNAIINESIGNKLTGSSFRVFAIRSYVSTMIGQFVDNMVFALIVSHVFFGWSMTQCITCAFTGCILELLSEVIFSPLGYKVSKGWERDNVGKAYLELRGN